MTAPLRSIEHPTPDEAAADWLVRRDRGLGPADELGLTHWRSASDANEQAWRRAADLWSSFDNEPDVLLQEMRRAALRARGDRLGIVGWGLIAASAMAVFSLAGVLSWRQIDAMHRAPVEIVASAKPRTYETGVGGRLNFALSDGSQISLDTNSAVAEAVGLGRRDVRLLRGQAYFKVAPDARRPFSVFAGDRQVVALGTAFNVRLDGQSLTVALAKGHVGISTVAFPSDQVKLSPGQVFQASAGGVGAVRTTGLEDVLAWRDGYANFENEPLASALGEMRRYGAADIHISDPLVASLRVTGRFRTGDPVRFAEALTEIYPVRVVRGATGRLEIIRR